MRFFKIISRIVLPKIIVVGVDIQDRHVAFVANARQADRGSDLISGIEVISEDAIDDGELKNPHVLFNALQKLISRIPVVKLKDEPVVVLSVPPTHMYSEMIMFPAMSSEGLREAVRLKMETSLPWPLEKAYVDWKIRNIKDPRRIGVFIAAISREFLDAYLDVFKRGGWRVAACEFHLLSLAQAGNIAHEAGAHIFILIDEDGAEFAIFHGGELIMHVIKKFDPVLAVGGENRQALQSEIGFETKRLAAHAETELGIKVESVYLFNKMGIEAEIEKLEKEIDLPVRFFSPAENPALYIARGASLRNFSFPEKTINFVPPGSGGRYGENLILRTLRLWTNIVSIFLVVMLLVFGGFYVFLRGQRQTLEQETVQFKTVLDSQIVQSGELIETANEFNQLTELALQAASQRSEIGKRMEYLMYHARQERIGVVSVQKPRDRQVFVAALHAPTRDALLSLKKRIEDGRAMAATASGADLKSRVSVLPDLVGGLNIRSGAGTSYSVVKKMYPGESYLFVEESGGWMKIRVDGSTEGWVNAQYVKKEEGEEVEPVPEQDISGSEEKAKFFSAVVIPVTELAREKDLTVVVEFVF